LFVLGFICLLIAIYARLKLELLIDFIFARLWFNASPYSSLKNFFLEKKYFHAKTDK